MSAVTRLASSPLARRLLPPLTGVAMILVWFAIHALMGRDRRFLVPSPAQVFAAFRTDGPQLWSAAVNTGGGALLGFLAAVAISLLLSLFLSLSPLVRTSFYPYLMILQMTPIIVFAPILILWVGPGLPSIVVITFLICFFPMTVNTTQGLISTDRNLVDLFRMYRVTKAQEIFLLRLPGAVPYFFTGLRIAATLAPIGAIVGDFYAGTSVTGKGGLGFLTLLYSSQFEMAALYATAAVSCMLGALFVTSVLGLAWLAMHKWHDSFSRTDI